MLVWLYICGVDLSLSGDDIFCDCVEVFRFFSLFCVSKERRTALRKLE